MPYRRVIFEENQPFHITSRAVEERKIFEKEDDCYRFIFQVLAVNMGKPAPNLYRRDIIKATESLLQGEDVPAGFIIKQHAPLVSILDFSLVVNHYHFYLVSNIKNGISNFIKKLNISFAMYFNLKYHRKGSLFGSRYKSVPVETDFQANAVSRYVSIINPLDVYQGGWRENGLNNEKQAFDFLKRYKFSSFPDKIGERFSKIIAPKEVIEKYCPLQNLNSRDYSEFVKQFLKERSNRDNRLIFLE